MKTGSKLKSAVCDTEVMVIKPADCVVCCGGAPMLEERTREPDALDPEFAGGTLIGKRYTDELNRIELLCVKSGQGALSIEGKLLSPKDAKPLPSSD
jgi:hypothetical protein